MQRLALRDRLAVSFALALALAYVVIAVGAVLLVNRALRTSVDSRLTTVAQAIVTIAGDGREEVDRKDRQQFAGITGDASGALVLDADGGIVLGTTDDVPDWARTATRVARAGHLFSVRTDGHELRALVERRHKHDTANIIIVWQSMQIVRDAETALLAVLGGFGIIVAIGGYAAGAQIARRGLLPLTHITAIVADIAAHDLDARVGPQPHADELGRLAATFDRMLDRLQAAFERQRRFTADASHDLRAPLATLRAEVDLALRRDRTTAEYRAALRAIADDADQLDRLIDALLAAARSDAAAVVIGALDLSAVTRNAIQEMAPYAHANNVLIVADLATPYTIAGDGQLLARAIAAALHNAVKFSPPGSDIHVGVTSADGGIELRVCDEGPGFSSAALTHALERFWRDDGARGRRCGSGLGLAIASDIVRRCGGAIVLENGAAGGAKVILSFPAQRSAVPIREPV